MMIFSLSFLSLDWSVFKMKNKKFEEIKLNNI